jgi:alpha-mannosidase
MRTYSHQAMIFNEDGLSLQGITGGSDARRVDFPLKKEMRSGVTLYAE